MFEDPEQSHNNHSDNLSKKSLKSLKSLVKVLLNSFFLVTSFLTASSTDLFLEEDLSLRDVAQQELHGDAELGHVLLEPGRRILWSLSAGLQEMTVSLGVSQLDSLDAAQVVVVPSSDGVRSGQISGSAPPTWPTRCCWPAQGRWT